MPLGLDPRPTAMTIDLETLVDDAWKGRFRVPHFQRDYRWDVEDVARLFDSIVRGYPIGSLLLWVRGAPQHAVRLGALEISGAATSKAYWVVDGQQRVTCLANALHPDASKDERFSLAYDLKTDRFVHHWNDSDPSVVPLPILFDLKKIIEWFAGHPELADRLSDAAAVTSAIRNYKVPAYQVEEADGAILRDIFDRMNNYGKRLSKAEVFTALFAGDEDAHDSKLTIQRIGDQIDESLGFGRIDDDTILRAILARRGPDVERDIRSEFPETERRGQTEFSGERPDDAYSAGGEAIRRAVTFLQEEAGVPHVTFLPYRYLLIVLSRFFAHHPEPNDRNTQLLRRWYWRAALVGREPFKGSISAAVRSLCAKIQPEQESRSVQGLLEAVNHAEWADIPVLTRFRASEAATRITLSAWWDMQPRSFTSGEPFDRTQVSNLLVNRSTASDLLRPIVRSKVLRDRYKQWAANRVIVATDDVIYSELDNVLTNRPLALEPSLWNLVLQSHCIPQQAVEYLAQLNIERFMEVRHEALESSLRTFLERVCEWDLEDTPPLEEFLIEDLDEDNDGTY